MSMNYVYKDAEGNENSISTADLQRHLSNGGIQATISPDGMTATILEADGSESEGPVRDLIDRDYGKVVQLKPNEDATDYGTIDNTLKAGVAQFGSDSLKAKYLQIAMENAGFEDPKIVGSGDDWFRFDPSSGRYMALTNKPGAELSDVLTYAPEAARTIGSIVGSAPGVITALTGAGAIPGAAAAAAGSAVGGQVGKRGVELLQSVFDPNYAQALKAASGEEILNKAKDMGVEALTDAAVGVIPVVGPAAAKAFFAKGGLTRGAGFAARGVESGFKATEQLAAAANKSELARALALQATSPTLGAAQGIGYLAQAPQWLATKGLGFVGQGMEKLGKTEAAQALKNAATASRGKLNFAEEGLNAYSNAFMPKDIAPRFVRPQARDTLGNLGKVYGEKWGRPGLETIGETTGRVFDATGTLGRGLEQSTDAIARAGLKGIEKVSTIGTNVGRAGRMGADFLAPLEGRSMLHGAKLYSEEQLPWRRQ